MYLPCFPFAAHCAAGLSTCAHSRLPESRNFLHPCSKKLDQLNRKMGPVEVTNPSLIVFYLVVSLLENLVCIVVWNYCCILFLHLRLGEGESWSLDPIFECWDFRVRSTHVMTVGTELAPGPNAVDITPTKDAGIMKEIKVIIKNISDICLCKNLPSAGAL